MPIQPKRRRIGHRTPSKHSRLTRRLYFSLYMATTLKSSPDDAASTSAFRDADSRPTPRALRHFSRRWLHGNTVQAAATYTLRYYRRCIALPAIIDGRPCTASPRRHTELFADDMTRLRKISPLLDAITHYYSQMGAAATQPMPLKALRDFAVADAA